MHSPSNSGSADALGNIGQEKFILLTEWPRARVPGTAILCPALHGLPRADSLALAMLPIHDANGLLLDVLENIPLDAETRSVPDFAAVCLSDPFRRMEDVFAAIRDAGIAGIINLPSISALMTSSDDRTFGALFVRETNMLARASAAGFRVIRVVCDDADPEPDDIRHADFQKMAGHFT